MKFVAAIWLFFFFKIKNDWISFIPLTRNDVEVYLILFFLSVIKVLVSVVVVMVVVLGAPTDLTVVAKDPGAIKAIMVDSGDLHLSLAMEM